MQPKRLFLRHSKKDQENRLLSQRGLGIAEVLIGLIVFASAAILLGRARLGFLGSAKITAIGANCAEASQNVLTLVNSWGSAAEFALDPFILASVGGSQRPNKVSNSQTIAQAMTALVPERTRVLGGTGLLTGSWYPYSIFSIPTDPMSPRVPLPVIGTGPNPPIYNSLLIGNSVNAIQSMLVNNSNFCLAPEGVDVTAMLLDAAADRRVERITLKIEPFDLATNGTLPYANNANNPYCNGTRNPIAVPRGSSSKPTPGFNNASNNSLAAGFRIAGNTDLGFRVTAFVTMRLSGDRGATAATGGETKTCSASMTLSHSPDRVNSSGDPTPFIAGAPNLLIDDTYRLIGTTSAQVGAQVGNLERGSIFVCADYWSVAPGVNIIRAPGYSCDEGAMIRADTGAPLLASNSLWDPALRRYSLGINNMQQSLPGAIVDYRTAIFVVDPAGNTSRVPAAVKVRADELFWDISDPWTPPCGPWTCGSVDQTRVVPCRWRSDNRIQPDGDCLLYVSAKPPTTRTCRKDYTANIPAGLPANEQNVSCFWRVDPNPATNVCNNAPLLTCGTTTARNVQVNCTGTIEGPGLDASATSSFCPPPPPPTSIDCVAPPLPNCVCPGTERACGGVCIPAPVCNPVTQIDTGCSCQNRPMVTCPGPNEAQAALDCTAQPYHTYDAATCTCNFVPPTCSNPTPNLCTDPANIGCRAGCTNGQTFNPTSCMCECPSSLPRTVGASCCPAVPNGKVADPLPGNDCAVKDLPPPPPPPACVDSGYTVLVVPAGSPSDCASLGFSPNSCENGPGGAVNCPAGMDCHCRRAKTCAPFASCGGDLTKCQIDCTPFAPLVWNDTNCACDACPPAAPVKVGNSCCAPCPQGEQRISLPSNECNCQPDVVSPPGCTPPKVSSGLPPPNECVCPNGPTAQEVQDPTTCAIRRKTCAESQPVAPSCPNPGEYSVLTGQPAPNCYTCISGCECRKWCDPADLPKGICKTSGTTTSNDGNDVCVGYRLAAGAPPGLSCPPDSDPVPVATPPPAACDPGYIPEPDQLTSGACGQYQTYLRSFLGQISATCGFSSTAINPSSGLPGLCCCCSSPPCN